MRMRSVLGLIVLFGAIPALPAPAQQAEAGAILEAVDALTITTSKLRGLDPKSPISKGIKSKAEISQFIHKRIGEDYAPDRVRNEEKLLKTIGLLPQNVDYRQLIVNLLSEQVEGFYDPEQKTFFLASWLPLEGQEPVVVHELTHALQDQHFNVQKILEESRHSENDDRALARQALLEGDAMAVMLQYLIGASKRHFSEVPNLAFIMQTTMEAAQAQYAVLKTAPRFLKETLIFPYGYGAAFLQYSWQRNPSWDAVNRIYADLPASTEQILHPEKYFGTRDNPKPVDAQSYAARLGANWKVAYKNVFGEFALGLMLNLHLNDERARRSSTGWGGDQILLLENENGKSAVLLRTLWDTGEDADRFFAAMDEWFRQHYPNESRTDVSPAGFSVVSGGAFNAIRRDGAAIQILLGLPESEKGKLEKP